MGLPLIVILEDDTNRMREFYKKLKDRATIEWFEDVDMCEAFIIENKNKVSMIFLDHDLGGEIYVNSQEYNTGYTMAKKIKEIYGEKYPEIIIHSLNPAGAKNIQDVLPNGERIPFPTLIRGL